MPKGNKKMSTIKYIQGEGSLKSNIVVIGESPGSEEEQQGKPFVGRSGQLLNKWLEIAQIKRTDLYITNAVKVRPPENRTPTDEELLSWKPLLIHELYTIKPKVVITVGACSTKVLLEDDYISITKQRGQLKHKWFISDKFKEKFDLNIYPIFHPMYIIRNPKLETLVIEDLQRFRNEFYGKNKS